MNILWSLFIFCFGLLSGVLIWQNHAKKSEIVIKEKTEIENIIYSFKKNNHKILLELYSEDVSKPKFKIKYLSKIADEKLKSKVVRLLELFSETETPPCKTANNIKKSDLKVKITSNNKEFIYFINREKINSNIATKNFIKLFQIYSLNT